jgi:hypothetical protein
MVRRFSLFEFTYFRAVVGGVGVGRTRCGYGMFLFWYEGAAAAGTGSIV